MKALFIATIILFASSFEAQDLFYKAGEKYKPYRTITVWDGGPAFDVTEVPDKWKNESGVVIAYKSQEHLHSKGAYLYRTLTYRYRIKIQDKVAVESFSNLFDRDMGDKFKINIIKPDGEEIYLDTDDISEAKKSASTDKFSIPNLEVGDILDYYFSGSGVTNRSYSTSMYSFINADEDFPILYKEVEWLLHKDFEFKIKGVNGMPKIEEKWFNAKLQEESNISKALYRQVSLKHTDIERLADNRYVYNAQVIPFIRYKVFPTHVSFMRFSNPSTVSHKTETNFMSYKDIGDFVYEQQKKFRTDYSIRSAMFVYNPNIIKKAEGRTAKQTLEIIEAIHHAVKYKAQPLSNYESNAAMDPSDIHDFRFRMRQFSSLSQIFSLANEFDEYEISYDVIAITPVNSGRINEVMFENEMKYALRVNLPDGNKFFYSGHGIYNDYNVNNYLFEGAKGIVVEPKKKRSEEVKFEEIEFPISSHTENVNIDKKNITLSEDLKFLNVKSEKSYTGKLKINESFRILRMPDIFTVFGNEYKQKPKSSKSIEKEKERAIATIKEERLEKYKEELESDYEVESYDDITIENPGIREGEPLIVTESYSLDGLLKKAGKNYVLNAGILIGSQVALESDEYERDLDVFTSYPRSFVNEITITLPEGYTVQDLDPLNVKLENEAGFFESTCVLEGNQIKFNTTKNYKVNFLPAEKWPLMTEFLDIAFDLNQKKLLISEK